MTECANVEMRERLPDLAHERLCAADAADVAAHVTECADCAAELELIRAMMRSAPSAPAIDVAAIVAQLPRPQGTEAGQPQIVKAGRLHRFGMRQVPLALGLALAASLAVIIVRKERMTSPLVVENVPSSTPAVAPSGKPAALTPVTPKETVVAAVARNDTKPSLSLGGSTSGLSDENLAILVDEIADMDAVPGAEPESFEPSLDYEDDGR